MASSARVEARCLGSFSLTIDGVRVEKWHAGKARGLFQLLLAHRGRVVLRDRICEALWPDLEWRPTTSSLKVAVFGVRRILATHAGAECPVAVVSCRHGYQLRGEEMRFDVADFEAEFEAGCAAQ